MTDEHTKECKDARFRAWPTPVADALQVVDQTRADPYAEQASTTPVADAYLGALENLADAVRSHGIGAELGQLRATARLAQWLAEAERAVTAAGEGQDVAGLLEVLEALTAAVRDVQGPQRPRYEHAHCTGCGAWYLAGHGPGCGVGAAEAARLPDELRVNGVTYVRAPF